MCQHLPTPLAADNVSLFTVSNMSLLSNGCVDKDGIACVDGIADGLLVIDAGLVAAVDGVLVVPIDVGRRVVIKVVVDCGPVVIGRLVVVTRWLLMVVGAEVVVDVVVVGLCWC